MSESVASDSPGQLLPGSPLISPTPAGWADVALADLDAFLQDHANCERKAAALCMSFISKYPNRTQLIDPMVSLAREELEHFAQVFRIMQKRGLALSPNEKDPYVQELTQAVRSDGDERFLDRLIVSGLIEARSCERFQLTAQALTDPGLQDFYQTLARAEAGHFRVFFRLAEKMFPPDPVAEAVTRLAVAEDRAMRAAPWRPAVH
jgi:tRNA-(ms[2]io[6]A)-hydroxylase